MWYRTQSIFTAIAALNPALESRLKPEHRAAALSPATRNHGHSDNNGILSVLPLAVTSNVIFLPIMPYRADLISIGKPSRPSTVPW